MVYALTNLYSCTNKTQKQYPNNTKDDIYHFENFEIFFLLVNLDAIVVTAPTFLGCVLNNTHHFDSIFQLNLSRSS